MEDTRPHVASAPAEVEHQSTIETPFADAEDAFAAEQREEVATGDAEPMSAAHDESPFEQTANYTAAAMTVEEPVGFHVEAAPLAAEVPAVIEEESPFAEPEAEPAHAADDVTNTITMGDLYAQQGLVDDARQIYQRVFQRDPESGGVGAKAQALAAGPGWTPSPQSATP